jgi:hypothetical protein
VQCFVFNQSDRDPRKSGGGEERLIDDSGAIQFVFQPPSAGLQPSSSEDLQTRDTIHVLFVPPLARILPAEF